MTIPSGLRKAALTAHLIASIGWLGAVAAFLSLALTGMMSQDRELVRAAYLVMGVITWWVIVPLALLGVTTGVISSLITKWGLFRSYWVLLKLLVTVPATFFLLEHTRPIDLLAGVAQTSGVFGMDLLGARREMVIDAVAALVVLLFLTGLSVYKPRGLTPYGQWKQNKQHPGGAAVDVATSTAQGMVDECEDNGVRPATFT